MNATTKVANLINKCNEDRSYFGRELLGSHCWEKQIDIKNALKESDFVLAVSSHGVGKTYVAADIVLEFLYTHRNSYVITTATTATQVKNILWAEINAKHNGNRHNLDPLMTGRCILTELKLGDQWKAIGLSPRRDTGQEVATSMQGYHAEDILVVIDEAGGVEKAVWDAIHGLLTSANAKLLAIGNPTHVGTEFYKIFKLRPKNWKIIEINTLDLPNITEVYGKFPPTLAGCKALMKAYEENPVAIVPYPKLTTAKWFASRWYEWGYDNPLFQSRVLGRFPEKGEDSVFNATSLEEARYNQIKIQNNYIGRSQGVDVARFGDDKSVFTTIQDGQILTGDSMQGKDGIQVGSKAMHIHHTENIEVTAVDGDGVGVAVEDEFTRNDFDYIAFHAGSPATKNDEYHNIKAQMYFELARGFERGEVAFPEETPENKDFIERTISDLLNIRYTYSAQSNKLIIVSKKEMKAKNLPSPDHAEALMIAFWASKYAIHTTEILQENTIADEHEGTVDYGDTEIEGYSFDEF